MSNQPFNTMKVAPANQPLAREVDTSTDQPSVQQKQMPSVSATMPPADWPDTDSDWEMETKTDPVCSVH